jgi:uncharacterized membrane protein
MPTALDWTLALAVATAVGCALVAGVFFAFSNFVMGALARLPDAQGAAAMRSINVVVLNPGFLGLFLGTAVACAALAAAAFVTRAQPGSAALAAGSALYLVGCLGVTMACNVPRNERLARTGPASDAEARAWREDLRGWTRWNHVRTAASLAATLSLALAVWQRAAAA